MGERLKKLNLDKKLLLFTAIGVFLGIALFSGTAGALKATDTGEFCSSCHIMESAYESFTSSNHASLYCNDCHVPNNSLVEKLPYKAKAGMSHMYMNTIGANQIPKVLHAKASSQEVINNNCIMCHEPGLQNINHDSKGNCIDCHRTVPHNGGDYRPTEWFEPKQFHFADLNKKGKE
ncbi:cytochrome c nitrite reductase small subunit [Evansella vedderi]|uniref:Cytochrome c nitrite reductase small subunit n=1 Tax=Evansella vedderi TaxID=38282 RepID=A0ABT9ZVN5_9BACI|nr:NapC/NirT family cytochrome c [Evansella vedderi]MDQ0255292.1 cytochrome c nitrite reductase small subunit [Evansella vedderi]